MSISITSMSYHRTVTAVPLPNVYKNFSRLDAPKNITYFHDFSVMVIEFRYKKLITVKIVTYFT